MDFRSADLTDANLFKAVLQDARLDDAILEGANLERATLADAWLRGARLRGALGLDSVMARRIYTGEDENSKLEGDAAFTADSQAGCSADPMTGYRQHPHPDG